MLDGEVVGSTYNIFRRDREKSVSLKTDGGGVFIITRNNLKALKITEFQSDAEDVWVRVEIQRSVSVYLCCVYLPPNDDGAFVSFISKLSWISQQVSDNKIIICGDFNCHSLDWVYKNKNDYLTSFVADQRSASLMDTLSFCGLLQLNYVRNCKGKILDLILSNCSTIVASLSQCSSPLVIKDNYHPSIEFDLLNSSLNTINVPNYKFRNFRKANYNIITNNLLQVNWKNVSQDNTIENNISYLYRVFQK